MLLLQAAGRWPEHIEAVTRSGSFRVDGSPAGRNAEMHVMRIEGLNCRSLVRHCL